jgi:hypothetical protein
LNRPGKFSLTPPKIVSNNPVPCILIGSPR